MSSTGPGIDLSVVIPVYNEEESLPPLWDELRDMVEFWVEQGVTVFRVDNPHTKPFAFWQWLIADVKTRHPETIFLAEAFSRPRVMYRLAKLGFSQSYTYFTWRNTKHEITEYFIAWLAKSPPRPDWTWDSRRELAIRGESASFRRSMVEAYAAMARHMPDGGFQVVMFTH